MRSTFYGFEIAKSGLYASQLNIDLIGHNIANADTVGYTRQRLNVSARELAPAGQLFREVLTGYSGAGVRVNGIEQVRNEFLDRQYRHENGLLNMWSTRADSLSYIESLFSDTGDSSLSGTIDSFFKSVQKLTENPESKEYRTNVMQNALKMTEAFNHLSSQLTDKLNEQNAAVKTVTDQVNDIARNLADLNDQIFRFEVTGDTAVDLRDQRNLLLDKLAGLVDTSYSEGADGKMTVTVGGHTLVNHITYDQIAATPDPANNNFYALTWTDAAGPAVAVTTGSLKAYLDMRDNATAINPGIPYLMNRLDTLALSIATEFNAIHKTGYTMPDGGTPTQTGVDFFTASATGTAASFTVAAAIQNDVYQIAASSQSVTAGNKGNNENALAMVRLQNRTDLTNVGSIEGYLKGYLAGIGVEANHTNAMRDGEQTLMDSIEQQRQSVSGVSVDEETTNLIRYQHAYAANARVITTIDEYLDTLINKTGLVGR